jgi:hypothetical protein
MRRAIAALLLPLAAAPLLVPSAPRADAALDGRTRFEIDGDLDGQSDWDAPYEGLMGAPFAGDDACVTDGSHIDPDQLNGRLDTLDLGRPNPTPGNVAKKGDLCRVWHAVEYLSTNGRARPVFYGAWSRPANVSGEITVFYPLVGPAVGKSDDVLVAFQYDSARGGARGVIWRWSGTIWRPTTQTAGFEVAVDDSSSPTFGEFALDLVAAGIVPPGSCSSLEASFVFTRTGQENGNGELQDFAGMDPLPISNCSRLEVTTATDPRAESPTTFGFTVGSLAGGAVDEVTGAATADGGVTVPTNDTFVSSTIVPRTDLTLTESAVPTGWDLAEITCTATDADGTTSHFDLFVTGAVAPDRSFPTFPGGVTRCSITNERHGTITIVKVAEPADGTDFPFAAEGPNVGDFTVDVDSDASLSDRRVFTDLRPNEDYSFTETPVPDGWELLDITCAGGDTISVSLETANATIFLKPGEDVICTFSTAQPVPDQATLMVLKVALPADGTDVPFTGSGAVGSFTLDNDPSGLPDATNDAYEVFTVPADTYTVKELVPAGWNLDGIVCSEPDAVVSGNSVDVFVDVGHTELCVFANYRPATLTVVEATAPAGGSGFTFTAEPMSTSFTLADGARRQFTDLAPDLYSITETAPDGWVVSDVTCTGGSTGTVDLVSGFAEVLLGPGEDGVCTYTNTRTASITVTTDVVPDTVAGPPDGLGFDTEGDGLADRFVNDGESFTLEDLSPGTYSVDELVPAGWVADIECSSTGNRVDADLNSGTATITVIAGEAVSCTYTNTKLGQISVRKDSSPDDAQDVQFTASFNRTAPVAFVMDDDGDSVDDPDNGLVADLASADGLRPGLYTITEMVPEGWALSDTMCSGAVNSSVEIDGNTVAIDLRDAEAVDCVFSIVQGESSLSGSTEYDGSLPSAGGGGLLSFWPIAELLVGIGLIAIVWARLRQPRASDP